MSRCYDGLWAGVMATMVVGAACYVRSTGGPVPGTPESSLTECHYRDGALPDPQCTPGSADSSVTQATVFQTICVAGYSERVRPPVTYTGPLKARLMNLYGMGGKPEKNFELDHLIPLELGGAPSDIRNLWPEPGTVPNLKDRIENSLHALVCSGRMTLAEAQERIKTDWRTALL